MRKMSSEPKGTIPLNQRIDCKLKVFGPPASGKTRVMEIIRPALERAGLKVKVIDDDGHVIGILGLL